MSKILYDKPFANKSGETIPAYAVLQVSGWQEAGELGFFQCVKPDGEGVIFLLNGPRAVANNGMSMAASPLSHVGLFALYNTAATPELNQGWNPEAGSWKLKKAEESSEEEPAKSASFFIIGDAKGSGEASRVRVSGVGGGSPGGGSSLQWYTTVGTIPKATTVKFQGKSYRVASEGKITPWLNGVTPPQGFPYPQGAINPIVLELDSAEASQLSVRSFYSTDILGGNRVLCGDLYGDGTLWVVTEDCA